MKLAVLFAAAALALTLCSCSLQGESSYSGSGNIGTTAEEEADPDKGISIREGKDADGALVAYGKDIAAADAQQIMDNATGNTEWVVLIHLNEAGAANFAEASRRLAGNGSISIWFDGENIFSAPVAAESSDGIVLIEGDLTEESAKELANKLNRFG